ncbi:MAG: T9SS type A sorting domain-containing protein [Bacteroidetes bacterium]|nr:T9SS type A sorting domain-containing protein [Bacteroidota bacterium]
MNHITVLLSSKINFVFAALVLLLSSSMSFSQDICPDADVEVATQSFSYSPEALTVDAGTAVGWVNFGGTHDVNGIASSITGAAYNNPEAFSLGTMSGNASGVCLGTFTFTVPGVYTYDCSIGSHAENGMVATLTVTSTSIVDELEDLSVLIFPNPVSSTLTINLNNQSTLQVFDAVGKLVEETGAVSTWVLNVSNWEKGLYTVQTQAGKTHKFIVE